MYLLSHLHSAGLWGEGGRGVSDYGAAGHLVRSLSVIIINVTTTTTDLEGSFPCHARSPGLLGRAKRVTTANHIIPLSVSYHYIASPLNC